MILRSEGGRTFNVSLERLSPADQEYVRKAPPPQEEAASHAATLSDAVAEIDALVIEGITAGNESLSARHARDVEHAKNGGWKEPPPFVPIKPNPPLTEEQFVRRAYLDIAGRIPTAAEVSAFLKESDAKKRSRLIDRLLDSDGFASHLYNELADMLRISTDTGIAGMPRLSYGDWLKQQLRNNRPYDEIVRDLLTAKGKAWDGPAGYYLRDHGKANEHLSNMMRAFAGVELTCAECHDHPYSDWTQRQYYELAAFFGVRTENAPHPTEAGLVDQAVAMATAKGAKPGVVPYSLWKVLEANRWQVRDATEYAVRLPADYKYRNGKPGEAVEPKLIRWSAGDELTPPWKAAQSALQSSDVTARREAFAKWLTHPQHPRFAMTIAHRLWGRAFGKPISTEYGTLANPLVNLLDLNNAANPALLKRLEAEMVRVNFDLKAYLRTVYHTEAWQRLATTEDVAPGWPYYFQGPVLRRMTPEQTWDSLVTLAQGEAPLSKDLSDLYGRSMDVDLDHPKMNAQTLLLKMAAAAAARSQLQAPRLTSGGVPLKFAGGLALMRASEHPQPAPPEHVLRILGQSDREWMDSNVTDGSVPQVLMLMNGALTSMVTQPESHVLRARKEAGDGAAGVESLFLGVLGRKPAVEELERALSHLKTAGKDGWSDLAWALMNTREFLFVQ